MTRHIGSLDSIIHDLTNRSGHLCEHSDSSMIQYMVHVCTNAFV